MPIILTLAILLLVVTPALAREDKAAQGGNVPTAPSPGQGPTDAAEMEAFMDVQAMDGNLCRCGAHPRIVAAIRTAAREMREKKG